MHRYQISDRELEMIIQFYLLPPARQDELRRRWNLAGAKPSDLPGLDFWKWIAWQVERELSEDLLP
jgi:hypothetical protein